MAYGGYSPRLKKAVINAARKYGIPDAADELIATTLVESGGRLRAVGDSGNSGGPFQENSAGRGAGIPMEQRFNPEASADRAAKEFAAFVKKGYSAKGFNPELAYAAQRPASKSDYISKLNQRVADARKILGGGAPSDQAGDSLNAPVTGDDNDAPQGVNTQSAQAEDKLGPALDDALMNRNKQSSSDRLKGVVNGIIDQGIADAQAEAVTGEDRPADPAPPQPGTATSAPYEEGAVSPILPGNPGGGAYGYSDPEGQDGKHLAIDWFGKGPVKAPENGKIVRVSASKGNSGQVYGGTVAIRTESGKLWVMRHVEPNARVGDRVTAGTPIASVTRWSDNPSSSHAHVELYKEGSSDREYSSAMAMNPYEYLKQRGLFK